MDKKTQQIAIPFISVLLGILLGAIIMWIFGYDALWGYEELFKQLLVPLKYWRNFPNHGAANFDCSWVCSG